MTDDLDSLPSPLFEEIHALGHWNFNSHAHFEVGSLFWSLTRLFGFYDRIVSVYDSKGVGPNHRNAVFLASDVESFIIRFRVILNDVAFVFRQLYPPKLQGLLQLEHGRRDRNKEMSFRELHKFLKRVPQLHPSLLAAIESNRSWLYTPVRQREDILHYKAMVLIFEPDNDNRGFAIIKAAGDEPSVATPEGGRRLITMPVFKFVNEQTVNLVRFINTDLVHALNAYAHDNGLVQKPLGIPGSSRMTCAGIRLFRQINDI